MGTNDIARKKAFYAQIIKCLFIQIDQTNTKQDIKALKELKETIMIILKNENLETNIKCADHFFKKR